MRIAYFLHLDVHRYEGVAKKITDKITTWEEMGHTVMLFCVVPTLKDFSAFRKLKQKQYYSDKRIKGLPINFLLDWFSLSPLYSKLIADLRQFKPDILYYRKNLYSPVYTRVNAAFKSIVEINTNETSEFELLAKEGLKYKLINFIHKRSNKKAFEGVGGIISVTHEIIRLEGKQHMPHLVLPNAIPLDRTKFIPGSKTNILPRLVFIGTPGMPWHGVDILLEVARRTEGKLEFDIIGYTAEELGEKLPPNVTAHGFQPKEVYTEIIKKADIGVGTLALFRKGMNEACPLKVREYISFGKPVILAYEDTALIDSKPHWILTLPNNREQTLERIDDLLSFCYELKASVISFETAYLLFDSINFEMKRLDFFKQINARS